MRSLRVLALAFLAALVVTACGDKSPGAGSSANAPSIGAVMPSRGPTDGHTVAIIKGNNFRAGTTVSFGDSAAVSVKVVDSTTLTVETPPNAAGKVNVVVTSEGQSTTFTDGFEYYQKDSTTAGPPSLSGIQPNTGPASGGTVAMVTGDLFQDGALLFVGRSPASDVVVTDPMSLTGTLPAGDVGSADVEVTNPDGQTAILVDAFAFSGEDGVPPVLSAVSPVAGTTLGGTSVALAGTGFKPGALIFFGGRTASGVTVMGTVASGITPPGAPGVVDVAITNPDGRSSILRRGYNYYVGGPVLSRLTPNFGPPDGGTEVTIDGRNFSERVVATFGGRSLSGLRRIDDRTLIGTSPAGPAGAADVRVENADGQSDTLENGWAWGGSPPPTFSIARVTPELGPIAGGTRVTVIGSGFESGAEVTFGGQPGTGVQVVGGATISCVTPAGMIGPVEVVVTQGGGRTAKLPLGFWYFDPSRRGPTPSIAAVTPALGPQTGGTTVLITGGGFASGARVFFGTGESTTVTVINNSTLTAITPPSSVTGPVDVRVQNVDGQMVTQNQGFVYVDPAALGPAPVLSSVTPNSGGSADTTDVVVSAQNVAQGALLFAGGVPATGVMVGTGMVSGTFQPHVAGAVDVVITNPDGQSGRLANGFTYNASPPTLSSVTPNTVPLGGGLKVLLSGRGFLAGATVSIAGSPVATSFVDDTLLFVTVPPHAAGAVDVTVTNPDNQASTLAGGLTYADIQLGNAPTLTAVSPSRGPTTGGTVALLIGTNFVQGTRVLFGSAQSPRVTIMNDTRLSAVAPAGTAGPVDVTVITPDGQSGQLLQGFTYVDPSQLGASPILVSVTPANGLAAGGTQTVLTGSGFQTGMLVFFGGFSASAAATQNAGIATATTPPGPTGVVDVAITNPDGQSAVLQNGFSYTARPELTTIFPAQGPTTGGTNFTLAGSNFAAGARVHFDQAEATNVMVASATVITGTTPAHALGVVDVRVTNPDGQSGTLDGGFTYNPPPSLALARPGAGPVSGGTTIAVTGTGFQANATVSIGGVQATSVRVVSDTLLYAITPAGSTPGAFDVEIVNPDMQTARLVRGFRYDLIDVVAQRATTWPTSFLPVARDDAQYSSDATILNLGPAPVTVTLASFDSAGVQLGSRALTAQIPAFGRTVVPHVLRFIEAATAATGRVASIAVTADGPVTATVTLKDLVSNDESLIHSATPARASSRLLLPYSSSVGAFKTWLAIRNVGTSAATVDITARDATGMQQGRLQAVPIPAGGLYTSDDVLGAMTVPGAVATLEISGANAQLIAVGRTYSNARLGGVLAARPYGDAAPTQTLAWVPDLSTETSAFYLVNTDATGPADATLDLRTSAGQSLGTRQVTVPANGFIQVPDLARTILMRTTPTQTVSNVQVSANRRLLAFTHTLNTLSSDVRLYNARPGGGVRLMLPVADPRTSLQVVNAGVSPANVEMTLRIDAGSVRGVPLKVTIPSKGHFSASLLLSSLGAGASSGWVEVRSTNGMPLVAVAKVGTDSAGNTGDALDLGEVLTVPTVEQIRPNQGPAPGGTMATVTGGYFLPGISFLFGDSPAPRAATAADDTAVVVSPPGTAGTTVSLTAINVDGATHTLTGAFSYVDSSLITTLPSISSVTPAQLSTLGGTPMQINGANFASQARAYVGLAPVTGATQINPGRIDGAGPAGPIGPADVTVTNPDGASVTLNGAVTYVVPPPAISSVTPASGPGVGGTVVRIAGTGFQVGASVGFGPTSSPNVSVLSSTEIDAVTPSGSDGPVAVTVQNPDGQNVTVNNAYTYVAAPTVAQVTPASGSTAGGTQITVTGTFFRPGAVVKVGTNDCLNIQVQAGGTTIVCNTPPGTAGPVVVRVINTDGQSGQLNNSFTYLAPIPPPIVSAVSPSFGPITGGTQVTIQGSNFQAGATVRFGAANSNAVAVISPSAIVATVPGGAAVGPVSVTVTNPDTQFATLANGFTYFTPADLPGIAIVSLTPNEGPPTGGTPVFISGQGFKVGVTVTFGGVASTSVTYLGPSALLAISPPHAAGTVSVTATNSDGANSTLANSFNYNLGVAFLPPPARLPLTNERGYEFAKLFDYDGDGDLDAFLARHQSSCDSDGNDQLWVNDGTGSFTNLPTFPQDARRPSTEALIADFDANGTRDVFLLSDHTSSNISSFYRNQPLGVFTRTDVANIASTAVQIRGGAVGDLDTDGFPDVYVAIAGVNYWYRNNQNGTFTATRNGLPNVNDDSRAVCIADWDRDGDDDIFVVNASNQQANYYLQGPAGTFVLSNTLIPVVGGTGVGCATAEFRPGSGIKDLVVVRDGQIYQYLKNDGTGRFVDEAASLNVHRLPSTPPSLRIGFPNQVGSVGGVVPTDLDLDGDVDLLMNHLDLNPRVQAYINDGTGFFTIGTATRIPSRLDSEEAWAMGDVNSDGRPDMLVPGNGSQPRLLFGGPNGVLQYATMRTIPEQSYCVQDAVHGDFDGDGDEDVFSVSGCRYAIYEAITNQEPASCRTNIAHLWTNDGAGGFTDETATKFPAFPFNGTTVQTADMDGDGDLDLVVGTSGIGATGGSSRDNAIRYFINNGSGIFTDGTYPRIPAIQVFATSIALVDIDKDGFLDIYFATDEYSCSNARHYLLLNTGNGFFFNVSGQLPYAQFPDVLGGCDGFSAWRVASGDFNGDTYVDLYIVGNGRNRMLFNRGGVAPGFYVDVTASNVPNVSAEGRGVVAGDLNNDTFTDLFVCNAGTGGAGVDRVVLGNATGVLADATATNWPGEVQPYPYQAQCSGNTSPVSSPSCDVADLDGDGDLDTVVAGGNYQGQINQRNRLYINTGNAFFSDRTTSSLPYETAYTEKIMIFRANADTKPDLFVGNCGQPYVFLQSP
ncbi:MAG: IPT/TIG domain-containing protein [Myxococcota bacterium]